MRMVGQLLHLGTTSLDVSLELAPGQANAYDRREFLEHLLFRCGPALQHIKVKSFSSWHVFQALKRFHHGFSSIDIEDPISSLFPSSLAARTETFVVRGRIGWPQLRFFYDSFVLPDVEGRLLTKEIVLPVDAQDKMGFEPFVQNEDFYQVMVKTEAGRVFGLRRL